MQKIKAVLDLGNGYIKGLIIGQDEGRDIILAKEYTKTQGYRKGKILDNDLFIKAIQTIIDGFQKKLGGEYIDEVIVGVSHPEMIVERITESKRIIGSDQIMSQDITHLSTLINDMSIKSNYETLKILPVYRTLDDSKIEKNPEGLQAKKLSLNADIFYIPKMFYQNIVELLSSLELNVVDIVPNILASVEALIDMDHKDLGTMIIDIGANQSSYAIYEEGYALGYGVIPVGGDEITKDISIGMQIDIKDAEKIKLGKPLTEDTDNQTLDERFLGEIITARYEQVLEKIHNKLSQLDKDGRLAGGIYLTGQATGRYNTLDLCKHIFKLATFHAKDISGQFGDISNNTMYHNCLGLYSRSKKYHSTKSVFSFRNMQSMGKGLRDSIINFFKDLF